MLLCGGLVAALCIAEGVVRALPSRVGLANFELAGGGNRPGCVRPSLTRGYEPIPSTCGVDARGARAYQAGSAGSPVRVMVVGDSLSTQTAWPNALTAALAAGWGDRAVVLETYGVPGYNTCQELSMLRETIDGSLPDVVLLQACPNDVRGSPVLVRTGGWVRYFSEGTVVEFPEVFLRSRFLTHGMLAVAPKTAGENLDSGGALAATCLRDLRDEVGARGVELVAVLFPLFYPDDAPAVALVEEVAMRSLLTESHIPFVELRPAYEAAGPMVQHRDTPTDFIHPSLAGQRIAAGAIASWMLVEIEGR